MISRVSQFLHRRHVRNMRMISKSSTVLTNNLVIGQPVPFEWNEHCEEVFQTIKHASTEYKVSICTSFNACHQILTRSFFFGLMLVRMVLELY